MPTRLHPKLSAKYYDPFQILKQVGPVAFWLQLPETTRIHPVFHVSQFKMAVETQQMEKELAEDLQGRGAFSPQSAREEDESATVRTSATGCH